MSKFENMKTKRNGKNVKGGRVQGPIISEVRKKPRDFSENHRSQGPGACTYEYVNITAKLSPVYDNSL